MQLTLTPFLLDFFLDCEFVMPVKKKKKKKKKSCDCCSTSIGSELPLSV